MQESTATESSVRNWAYRRNSHYNDTYVALGGDRLWSDVDYSSFSVTFNYIPQRSEAYGEDLLTDNKSGIVTPYQHWRKLNDKLYVGSVNTYHKHRFGNASVLDFLWQLSLGWNINKVNQTEDNDRELHSYLYDFHNSRVGVSFTPSYQFHRLGFDAKIGLNTYFQSNRVREQKEVSSIFKHREWNEYLYLDVNRAWGDFSLAASLGMDAVFRNVSGYDDRYYNLRPVANLNYRFNTHHTAESLRQEAPKVRQALHIQ